MAASGTVRFNFRKRFARVTASAVDVSTFITDIAESTLDSGARGQIWRAKFHDPDPEMNGAVVEVVLKTMSDEGKMQKYMGRELAAWSGVEHPNVLPFYGIYKNKNLGTGYALISPFMENGNVADYVKVHPDVERSPWVLDIAKALDYIHTQFTPPIVHNDVRAANILIDPELHARLADFGLAIVQPLMDSASDSSETSADTAIGNPRWMSPEGLNPIKYGLPPDEPHAAATPAADIYSFAMTIYEMYTGDIPFATLRNAYQITQVVGDGARPHFPEYPIPPARAASSAMKTFVGDCWKQDRNERPQPGTLTERVEAILQHEGGQA